MDTLLDVLRRAEEVVELDDFPDFVLQEVPRLVPCDSISYNEVDPGPPRLVSLLEPAHLRFEGDVELWERYMHQHPIVTRYLETGDGRAFKVSDFLSREEFRRLDVYREIYRPLRTEFQIALVLPAPPPLMVGIALNRERRDFSERDRDVLNLARPYLLHVHRGLEKRTELRGMLGALQQAAELGGRGIVLLGRKGALELVTEQAERLLAVCFAERRDGRLPPPLGSWIERQRRDRSVGLRSPPPSEPLVVSHEGGRVIVRFLPALRPGDRDALVLEEERALGPGGLRALGLTPREAEVLALVALGQTNAQVASELGIRTRTVQKHLEHVYAKLGVGTRTAAVAMALGRAATVA